MSITKAVIPVAGLGTRFLPATKVVAKELLPVVDTPAIEYVVQEASAAGLKDVLLITNQAKQAVLDHFDRAWELERALAKKGDAAGLATITGSSNLATIHAVRQATPLGLGHAVNCAREHVAGQPFAVLLGDDLIDPRDPLLTTMLAVQQRLGGSVVAMMRLPIELISAYGSAVAKPVEAALVEGVATGPEQVYCLSNLVEKPSPKKVPSEFGLIGRYVLNPAVFDALDQTEPGINGEVQLTDALGKLAQLPPANGGGVYGVVFQGRRYDTGNKLEYLKAVVRLASEHSSLGAEFSAWLSGFAANELEAGPTPAVVGSQTPASQSRDGQTRASQTPASQTAPGGEEPAR